MIGELLAEVRKDHRETQKDLADHLHVSIATVRSWERENSSPSHEMLIAICKLYDVSADYLLGLTRIERPEEFTREEIAQIREYEEFLRWKKQHRARK